MATPPSTTASSAIAGFRAVSKVNSNAASIVAKFKGQQPTGPIKKVTGGPGLEDLGVRADIAAFYRPQTAAEANRVFQKTYPDGEIIRDPEDKQLYFRISKDGDYRKLDPDILSDSGRMRDLIYDVAEFAAGEAPIFAGEALAFAGTKSPSAIGSSVRAFTGGAGGELVRQLSQVLSGKKEPTSDILSQAGETGLYSAGGELAARPFIRGVQMLRGKKLSPTVAIDPTAGRAIAAEARQGLPVVTPGQTVVSPILKRFESMGKQFSPKMIQFFEKQQREGVKKFRKIAESLDERGDVIFGSRFNLSAALKTATDQAERKIFQSLEGRYPNYRNLTSDQTGKEILGGVLEWDELAKRQVNAAYDEARQAATPTYDVGGMVSAAEEVLEGTKIATQRQVKGKLFDQYGDPIMKTITEKRRVGALTKEVKAAAQLMRDMDPTLPVVNGDDATAQLMKLRSTLWDAKTPAPGDVFRQVNRDAAVLYDALTKAMDNPAVDVEGAQALWKEAAQTASRRFAVLDKAVIGQIIKTNVKGGESQLARALVAAGKQSDVIDLKNLLPKTKFDFLRTFVAGELVADPSKIKSMDADVLGELFEPRQIQDFQNIADDIANLRSSEAAKAFGDNISDRTAARDFLLSATPAQTDAFIKTVKESPALLKEIKTTLINGIADASWDKNKKFSYDLFSQNLKKAKDAGLFRKNGLWTRKEIQAITDLRAYFNRVAGPGSSDAGIDLMSAQILSPGQLARGNRSVGTIIVEILHQIALVGGLGRIITNPATARFLRGQAQRRPTARYTTTGKTVEPEVLGNLGSNQLRAFVAATAGSMAGEDEETE